MAGKVKSEISKAESKITHGVFVVSTRDGDKVNAMTAAWVSRVSFTPPLVAVAVAPKRFSFDMIKNSGVFAVNVMGPDGVDTAKHFGFKTGHKTDKFADVGYDTKATGSPILRDALAWMDCKVVKSVEAGDHTLFIGEVIDGDVPGDEEPLVFVREDFYSSRK